MTQLEQDLTDRLAQSEKDRASWLHQHNVLAGRITAIRAALSYDPKVDRDLETCARRVYAERHGLESWKREMLTVTQWWDAIDAFIRKHRDAPLGLNVSDIALGWLKERDQYYRIIELWGVLHNTPPIVQGDDAKELFDEVLKATCEVLAPKKLKP